MKRATLVTFQLVITVLTLTVTSTQSYNNDFILSASRSKTTSVANKHHHDHDHHEESHHTVVSFAQVEAYLNSIGYTIDKLCQQHHSNNDANAIKNAALYDSLNRSQPSFVRKLDEEENVQEEEEESNYIQNGILAFVCVTIAALAAGLTMGLLSLELLDLRIKEMASSNAQEREQARSLVPLIKDHHRLLVTLLLMNALANEALPLFLDKLVPGYVAVILSVTLVLFFGEIIPSAIFTGPNQLAISSKLAPLVRFVLFILAPIAWPIAKMLDIFLHGGGGDHGDGGDGHGSALQKYDRSELSALVRLQFESRKAAKAMRKQDLTNLSDALVKDLDYGVGSDVVVQPVDGGAQRSDSKSTRFVKHIDEVNMVEGALQMQTKKVFDVMQPWKDVYSIPEDMVLNESNILQMYSKGYSRIPVYDPTPIKGASRTDDVTKQIKGLFKSRQLTVISAQEKRSLESLPLATPFCVSPDMNMVNLLNLLQAGKGHMAIVCLHPQIAVDALKDGDSIPKEAQVIGLVTLEDCLEELIQEEIYDEYDKQERITHDRMKRVAEKWKKFVVKRKKEREERFQNVVIETMEKGNEISNEETQLLPLV